MNGNDVPQVGLQAFVPAPFPTWPPPSGGAPVTTPELGPITNPFPYGSTQGANISTAPPSPAHPWPGTFYPKQMPTGQRGQNQGGIYQLPPRSRPLEVGPIKASPLLSQIQPPPLMGPAPQGAQLQVWEMGPIAGQPVPGRSFPAGSYLDGFSSS
jgi:hypothetical protein